MGQMAGDLGWRESEARAGGGGWASLAAPGGLDGCGWGGYLAETKNTGYGQPENGNGSGINAGCRRDRG